MAVENTVATCAVPSCDRRAEKRGYCNAHYRRWRRTGNVRPDDPVGRSGTPGPPAICAVPGCKRRVGAFGWCSAHYGRWRTHGDVRADVPIGRWAPVTVRAGERFGAWTVLRDVSGPASRIRALVRCDCGVERDVLVSRLRDGYSRSCGGCVNGTPRHGYARRQAKTETASPTYESWRAMRSRCLNPKRPSYPSYGGAGITVCDRWNPRAGGSFLNFLADMGERPAGTSIDRIDNDGNYEPGNCRWATPREQALNQRRWRPAAGVV